MKLEFPDDPVYSSDRLTTDPNKALIEQITLPDFLLAVRNQRNIVQVSPQVEEHAKYDLRKTVPTVDEDILDDLLDEEWNYFVDIAPNPALLVTGLFLIHPNNPLKPIDFHDAYISRGPQFLGSASTPDDIFCVFFIRNSIAYPIPNYKTLEVMLVERGLTYASVTEATTDQLAQFDMNFDGVTDIVLEQVSPIVEYQTRSLIDRSNEWSARVRYNSGYRPEDPFKRDPGDYINPQGGYFDKVYQRQTFVEALRARFEGRMVVLSWPTTLTGEAFDNTVVQFNNVQTDDLVNSVRLMTNGYWKQVTDGDVFRAYAYVNNFDLSGYIDGNGRYGVNGYINQLINVGGISVLQAENIVNAREGDDVAWNSFPHIVEADSLDIIEYETYINEFSNANDPFNIDYLRPYEPPGSTRYYESVRLNVLQQQAFEQNLLDNLVDAIEDKFETLGAIVAESGVTLNSVNYSLLEYFRDKKIPELYSIIISTDKWQWVKQTNSGVKVKGSENNLLRLIEKNQLITGNLTLDQENDIAKKWSRVPETLGLSNGEKYELPRDQNGRDRTSMKDDEYARLSIRSAISDVAENNYMLGDAQQMTVLAIDLDNLKEVAKLDYIEAADIFAEIGTRIAEADTLEQFQGILNDLNEIEDSYNILLQTINEINNFVNTVDNIVKDFSGRMYDAVQLLRKRVYENKNGKYGIVWPEASKKVVNTYLSGKVFNNYQPTE
jgi:hypothetical protein